MTFSCGRCCAALRLSLFILAFSLWITPCMAEESAKPDFGDEPSPASAYEPAGHEVSPAIPASAPTTSPASSAPTSRDSSPVMPPASVPASDASATMPATQPATAESLAAMELFEQGVEAGKAGRILEARGKLTEALLSGALDATVADKTLEVLEEIADKTLLNAAVVEGDPYTYIYRLGRGDVLARIVQKEGLSVTPTIIEQINRIDPSRLQVGQAIKLIRGPVHAVINSRDFTMDMYLQAPNQPKAFIKRVRVGLGRNGTPQGAWIVSRKTPRANWTPPPSMPDASPIAYGQAGYPLGKGGFWLALQGADERTKTYSGYGIHGTNEPDSIGKAASHGCVRLADDDIEFVYSLMAERISTVVIR